MPRCRGRDGRPLPCLPQVPAPAYHCRAGEPTATLDWPAHWWQNIIVNVRACRAAVPSVPSGGAAMLLCTLCSHRQEPGPWLPLQVVRQSSNSCGDLIFSSHITFLLVFSWTYAVLGGQGLPRWWILVKVCQSCLHCI